MAQTPDAILLAGGTDLGLRVSKDREALPAVISLAGVEELRGITADAGAVEFGGAVTYTEALPHLDRARRRRLLAREWPSYMAAWHALWDDAEDLYFGTMRPRSSFDLVVQPTNQ